VVVAVAADLAGVVAVRVAVVVVVAKVVAAAVVVAGEAVAVRAGREAKGGTPSAAIAVETRREVRAAPS
jgi:hypothetical protein